jgi:hypothetical protein
MPSGARGFVESMRALLRILHKGTNLFKRHTYLGGKRRSVIHFRLIETMTGASGSGGTSKRTVVDPLAALTVCGPASMVGT